MRQTSSHALPRLASAPARSRRTIKSDDGLKPARGIILGLGICSLFWTALATVVFF